MKAYFWIPFACLAGVIIGSWAPREEIRELKNRAQEEKARPKHTPAVGIKTFTDLANIPATARRRPRRPKPAAPAPTNTVVAADLPPTNAVADVASPTQKPARAHHNWPFKPDRNMSTDDLRARIEEAQELWQTRVQIARANWKAKLKVTDENEARFDAAFDEMNEHLQETMQALADQVAEKGKMTAELGLRLVGDATTIMAETYEKVGACTSPDLRDTVGNMPMTDFIDPGVASPLISVQGLFNGEAEGAAK